MIETVNHVALMRNVELVVKYLPGPVATTGRNGYSGVFRCAVDVDATFRRAEPPTSKRRLDLPGHPVGPRQNVCQGRARSDRRRVP
jgi:hypothetical protein